LKLASPARPSILGLSTEAGPGKKPQMLFWFRHHWIIVLMLGMATCSLKAQNDPNNTSTTTNDPVTGATLTLSGSSGFWNTTAPYLSQSVWAGSFNGSTLTIPTSTADPLASTVLNTSVLTAAGSPNVFITGSNSLTGSLIRPETITNTISYSLVTDPTLPSTPSTATNLTLLTGSQTSTTSSGTVSLVSSVADSSNLMLNGTTGLTFSGTTGLIKTGTGVTTVTNSTSISLGTSQQITGMTAGTVTLPDSSSNLTVSQGALSVTNNVNVTGGLDLQTGGMLRIQFSGSGSSATSNVLNVAGFITLSGDLAVVPPSDLPVGGTFVILNKTSPGAVSGTFASRPQGSIVRGNGREFIISYTGGDGNDVTLTAVSKLQAWRQAHFGTIDNSGMAADTADADGDGISNLMERTCSLDPRASSTLPVSTALTGSNIEYSYVRSVASVQAGDVFTVEWNDSLDPAGWSSAGVIQQVLTDDGTLQSVKALVPTGGNGQRFIRLQVTPAS
jgi:hypothetical protein